jgi:hypothetical protein
MEYEEALGSFSEKEDSLEVGGVTSTLMLPSPLTDSSFAAVSSLE